MLRTAQEMQRSFMENCHEGEGALDFCQVLSSADCTMGLGFMHHDVLNPGVSIGEHLHDSSEEVYYMMEGEATLLFDGKEFPFRKGDVSVVTVGHSHGVVNNSPSPAVLLVVGLFNR